MPKVSVRARPKPKPKLTPIEKFELAQKQKRVDSIIQYLDEKRQDYKNQEYEFVIQHNIESKERRHMLDLKHEAAVKAAIEAKKIQKEEIKQTAARLIQEVYETHQIPDHWKEAPRYRQATEEYNLQKSPKIAKKKLVINENKEEIDVKLGNNKVIKIALPIGLIKHDRKIKKEHFEKIKLGSIELPSFHQLTFHNLKDNIKNTRGYSSESKGKETRDQTKKKMLVNLYKNKEMTSTFLEKNPLGLYLTPMILGFKNLSQDMDSRYDSRELEELSDEEYISDETDSSSEYEDDKLAEYLLDEPVPVPNVNKKVLTPPKNEEVTQKRSEPLQKKVHLPLKLSDIISPTTKIINARVSKQTKWKPPTKL